MYVRALIVVLIILNAGVALWWALQSSPAAQVAPAQPPGVARLELLPNAATELATELAGADVTTASTPGATPAATPAAQASVPVASAAVVTTPTVTSTTAAGEASRAAAEIPATTKVAEKPADVAAAATVPRSPSITPVPVPATERCASLGPYAARSDADAALARIRGQASRISVREDRDVGVNTFRVMLPNVGDRAAAQAWVKRIAAAGMGDYYVIAQGEDNTVALGQYQSRERAERRQASLVSASFPAQLVPSGTGLSRWWIDVRSAVATTALQGAAGAARQRSLDCSALR
ncbi:SPOR domain-containing protein [Xanthomonas fragariae]|uniref:Sporulation related domain protein n=1 Tax=Xanthomonas fragariae TaxID=48664 RepID=A0ABY1RUK4_9XANT|nr:SPOR domain-containing protein [Xanthomonas fragariae]MDM7556243.1 SPOR domain-containing protein [Xanthomonas fragariae]MDM7559331.1 SPOR domain-containing protein [Xanthomonas fragariae]MDM7577010.1 SPOR domain-containing protein [Xanthomonas fragariae]MDM7580109.1 SPOR domain-containing protein [Xanthomonas fragariae]MDM7590301.1 SPOR domain-containing protein [Xanthomonas fragariae]